MDKVRHPCWLLLKDGFIIHYKDGVFPVFYFRDSIGGHHRINYRGYPTYIDITGLTYVPIEGRYRFRFQVIRACRSMLKKEGKLVI